MLVGLCCRIKNPQGLELYTSEYLALQHQGPPLLQLRIKSVSKQI